MLCGVMQIHWPQVFTEDGAYLSQMNLYTMLDVDPIGKTLQPDQSPTFVETSRWRSCSAQVFGLLTTSALLWANKMNSGQDVCRIKIGGT
jgi:hypothetical protein